MRASRRWVVNTVGFYNRKFFVLFLLYTFLACCWVIVTALPTLLALRSKQGSLRMLERQIGPHKFMACTMGTILDLALIVMLVCFMPFHMRMACLNETTIEGPSPEFHAGRTRNWQQVMGRNPWLWFLPVYGGGPDGDGIHWPSPLVTWASDGYGAEEEQQSGRDARTAHREEGRLLGGQRVQASDSSDGE